MLHPHVATSAVNNNPRQRFIKCVFMVLVLGFLFSWCPGCIPLALLFDQPLISVMRANPDPNEVRAILHSDGAVIDPDPRRPKISDFLEMQGGVR